MPDITMCNNEKCPIKESCYRFRAVPKEFNQSYFKFRYESNGSGYTVCNHFRQINSSQFLKPTINENHPIEKECHCGSVADKYRQRQFKNQLGNIVVRIFYRCRNCWSRISHDFIPEIDELQKINVFDLDESQYIKIE